MSISRRLRFVVLRRDDFTCRYCGRTASEGALEVDHVVPVAQGGSDDVANLVTACVLCNSGKGPVGLDDVSYAIELGYHVFESTWRRMYGDRPAASALRTLWNREVAPYLRRSMERNPTDTARTLFCCAIAHAEVEMGTEAYRNRHFSSPWAAMLAYQKERLGG